MMSPPARPSRPEPGSNLPSLVFLCLAAIVPLLRVLRDPTGLLPGIERSDVFKHAWSYWHTLAVIREGSFPWTRFLHAPGGGVLQDPMLLPSVLLAPVTTALGVVASANAWVWLSLALLGCFGFLMMRELGASRIAAAASALLLQTTPYLLGYPLASGVHERFVIWTLPLTILAFLRIPRNAAWTLVPPLAMATLATTCSTHGVIGAIVLTLLCPLLFARALVGPQPLKNLGLSLLGALGAGAGLLLALLWYRWACSHHWTLSAQAGWTGRPFEYVAGDQPFLNLSELLSWETTRHIEPTHYADDLYHIAFIGLIPAITALLGLIVATLRRQHASAWATLAGFLALLLTLGPVLKIGAHSLPNPVFEATIRTIPYFGSRSHPNELVIAFAILGAAGIASFIDLARSRLSRSLLAGLLVLLAIGERVIALPVPLIAQATEARVDEVIRDIEPQGSLVDVPRVWRGSRWTPGGIFLNQTVHHAPIAITINLEHSALDRMRILWDCESGEWSETADFLARAGFRWLVVHRSWFPTPALGERCEARVTQLLGAPRARDKDAVLYDLARLGVEPDPRLIWQPRAAPVDWGERLPDMNALESASQVGWMPGYQGKSPDFFVLPF